MSDCYEGCDCKAYRADIKTWEKRYGQLERLLGTMSATMAAPIWLVNPEKMEGLTVERLKQAKKSLDEITYPCNGIDYRKDFHPGHRAWIHRWVLMGTNHIYELAHKNETVGRAYHDDAMYNLYITPRKGEKNLNVKENAGAMLGQVQSHLADVEGKLKKAEAKLKENAEINKQFDSRALYVNLDGSVRNEAARIEERHDRYATGGYYYGPAREVRFEELRTADLQALYSREERVDPFLKVGSSTRHYRLMFSQGTKLHVYQEIG